MVIVLLFAWSNVNVCGEPDTAVPSSVITELFGVEPPPPVRVLEYFPFHDKLAPAVMTLLGVTLKSVLEAIIGALVKLIVCPVLCSMGYSIAT